MRILELGKAALDNGRAAICAVILVGIVLMLFGIIAVAEKAGLIKNQKDWLA